MAYKYTSHKSSLFLLELILAILFFSIASAVCVQLFVKSHLLSRQAEILSIAVNECSDAAEIILSADTDAEVLERLYAAYPDAQRSNYQMLISYDDTHALIVSCAFSGLSDGMVFVEARIVFENQKTGEYLYELNIIHQVQDYLLLEAENE